MISPAAIATPPNAEPKLPGLPDDPLATASRRLPIAALEWIADQGGLRPSGASPLAFLQWSRSSGHGYRERLGAVLRQQGLEASADAGISQALDVIERPDFRLRIGHGTPDRIPTLRQFFVRDETVVQAFADSDNLHLGPALRLDLFSSLLAGQLTSDALPESMEGLCLLPRLYELAGALWRERGLEVDHAIGETEMRAWTEEGGLDADALVQLLEAMVAAGVAEPTTAGFRLSAEYRPWLGRIWSGHLFEVERRERCLDAGLGEAERLIFAGPEGERILCEDLATGGPAESSEQIILFSRLSRLELGEKLRWALRPVVDRPPALRAEIVEARVH